jgi:hypothetical protein
MYRLDALQQCKAMQSFQVETFLPPTKRPNVRTDRSSPNAMDMYGFRPFRHPWKLLSAYEFTQAWRGEPLMIPSYYTNKGIPERSAWTEAGIQLSRTKEYKEGKSIARPGVHYCVVEAENEEYCTFPEYPADIYAVFRHAWILLRKKRPDVVVVEGLRMPSTARSDVDNAKYCSLFFRPWTLLQGDAQVPFLSLLGIGRSILEEVYVHLRPSARKTVEGLFHPKTVKVQQLSEQVQWHRA